MWKTTKRAPREIILDFLRSTGRSREKLGEELIKCLEATAQKGKLQHRYLEGMLLPFLSDPDVNVRAGACLAIGELGLTPALAIMEAMSDAMRAGFKPSDAKWEEETQKRYPETKGKRMLEEFVCARTTPELLQRSATAGLQRLEQRNEGLAGLAASERVRMQISQ